MKKKLIPVGNSWAVIIQKPILELLDINPEQDEIELSVENKTLNKVVYGLLTDQFPSNNWAGGRF